MKTLYLLRHGKSDWSADYSGDHDRPLNARGVMASSAIGKAVGSQLTVPDAVFCSTATRTRETWNLVAKAASWSDSCTFEKGLYLVDLDALVRRIRILPDSINSALFVGHQPTTATIASWITGEGWVDVPTGTFLAIDISVESWSDLHQNSGSLMLRLVPRDLIGGDTNA